VPTSHLANLRDLARASAGLHPGWVLRSDAPLATDAPPPGVAWPPRTVLDLRDDTERTQPHPLASQAQVIDRPLMAQASLLAMQRGERTSLTALYGDLIGPQHAPLVVDTVAIIATAPAPVLVHCSAGKDRTGVVAALILALVGVPRADIVADYVATAPQMRAVMRRMTSTLPWFTRMMARVALRGVWVQVARARTGKAPRGRGVMAHAAAMLDAPAAAIESVLDVWDAHPDGVEGWFVAAGGTAATVAALRARLRGV